MPDEVYRAKTYVTFLVFVVFVYINDRFLGHCAWYLVCSYSSAV